MLNDTSHSLFPIAEEEMDSDYDTPKEKILQRPPLRAVVLDNDETTGSYGIIFSLLTHLRTLQLEEVMVACIYKRLARALDDYQLFRPHLGRLLQTLDLLGDEFTLDAVIMYTNQTCELGQQTSTEDGTEIYSIHNLLYSVPLTIAYLMNEVYHATVFHKILVRPPLLRGIRHTSCPKSFSRILNMYPTKARSTEKILFVDDNASPEFITACPRTETHPHSYVRIQPYVRILTDAELETILTDVLHGMSVPRATLQAIKTQYRRYAPLERIGENNTADTELESLRLALIEFYAT
jgi:hypothetical protein